MAQIINLRRARKRAAKDEKERIAEANRQASRVKKRDIMSAKARNELEERRLNAGKLEQDKE
ncbi:MAG: DUF4169 family protein [Pseudomonadota bacterium]